MCRSRNYEATIGKLRLWRVEYYSFERAKYELHASGTNFHEIIDFVCLMRSYLDALCRVCTFFGARTSKREAHTWRSAL